MPSIIDCWQREAEEEVYSSSMLLKTMVVAVKLAVHGVWLYAVHSAWSRFCVMNKNRYCILIGTPQSSFYRMQECLLIHSKSQSDCRPNDGSVFRLCHDWGNKNKAHWLQLMSLQCIIWRTISMPHITHVLRFSAWPFIFAASLYGFCQSLWILADPWDAGYLDW